ncbi:MAG: tRNA pseudouridine(55) synthase TruB [Thermodesulfobacteriota bacterium]
MKEDSGILLIDKPAGMTSAEIVGLVKRLFKIRKVGHAGTLDPFATGLLICCINSATRIARFFLHKEKTYRGVIHLGIETDTGDPTGAVISEKKGFMLSSETVAGVFQRFEGMIEQTPPVYSALKHRGIPLYRLAREGTPIQKEARKVLIQKLEIVRIAFPEIEFDVRCSAGTYIRSLGADIGRALGCGGHIKELRRTECNGFRVENACTVSDLKIYAEEGYWIEKLISMSDSLRDLPECRADSRLMKKVLYGSPVTSDEIPPPRDETLIKIIDGDNRLVAILDFCHKTHQYSYCSVFGSPGHAAG